MIKQQHFLAAQILYKDGLSVLSHFGSAKKMTSYNSNDQW